MVFGVKDLHNKAITYFMMTFNFPDFVAFPLFDLSFFVFDFSLVSLRLYFITRNYDSLKKLQKKYFTHFETSKRS